jgi:thiamine pyrophosphate-dependent acetolactate synthase large subunit-like protein
MNCETVSDIIISTILDENGLNSYIFGLAGASWSSFDKTLENAVNANKITYIHSSSEYYAALSATTWSELVQYKSKKSRVGIAITTSGPGITTAITGITSSLYEETALICFCGIPFNMNNDTFQFINLDILKSVTKQIFIIDENINSREKIETIIKKAFNIARYGVKNNPGAGSVVIFVLSNVWLKNINKKEIIYDEIKLIKKIILTGNENKAIKLIIKKWNKSKSIVIRLGARVSNNIGLEMLKLANMYPQLYLTYIFANRAILSAAQSPKILDLDGPLGNDVANLAIKESDLVIECGIGYLFTTVTTEAQSKFVIRLYDDDINIKIVPKNIEQFDVNVNYVLHKLFKNKKKLKKINSNITIGDPTISFKHILNNYINQNNTVGQAIALTISSFYNLNLQYNIIEYDYYFVTDVGTSSFIFGQLARINNFENLLLFTQFSPIGCSLASTVGLLYKKPKDTIICIGDGGLLACINAMIDLVSAINIVKKRVLLLVLIDTNYTSVSLGEIALFGTFTSISSINYLLNNIDLELFFKAFNPVLINNGFDINIINGFRDIATGFTNNGLYVMLINKNSSGYVNSNINI